MKEVSPVAPCGIYCHVCPIWVADKGNHQRLKEILSRETGVAADKMHCDGCLSEKPFPNCGRCAIRDCAVTQHKEGCWDCSDFPCSRVELLDQTTRKWVGHAIPVLREMGMEGFMAEEKERCRCPRCGFDLFLGAHRCRNCGATIELEW